MTTSNPAGPGVSLVWADHGRGRGAGDQQEHGVSAELAHGTDLDPCEAGDLDEAIAVAKQVPAPPRGYLVLG